MSWQFGKFYHDNFFILERFHHIPKVCGTPKMGEKWFKCWQYNCHCVSICKYFRDYGGQKFDYIIVICYIDWNAPALCLISWAPIVTIGSPNVNVNYLNVSLKNWTCNKRIYCWRREATTPLIAGFARHATLATTLV